MAFLENKRCEKNLNKRSNIEINRNLRQRRDGQIKKYVLGGA